jgi:hypothetical protein
MSSRTNHDFSRCDEHEPYTARPEQRDAPFEQPESYAAQLGQPDVEDCSNSTVPDKAEPMDGKKKILVPVLTTMNKYLFDKYRLPMPCENSPRLRSPRFSRHRRAA